MQGHNLKLGEIRSNRSLSAQKPWKMETGENKGGFGKIVQGIITVALYKLQGFTKFERNSNEGTGMP